MAGGGETAWCSGMWSDGLRVMPAEGRAGDLNAITLGSAQAPAGTRTSTRRRLRATIRREVFGAPVIRVTAYRLR